ncbi:phage regulatory CII family protein [Oleidesulfovibrio sp.]|uniref:phage regulatory CII family protein n=1 Tax=Oleidesulfovibrio sp. TaxID=2909707 RepID=UPI003A898C10
MISDLTKIVHGVVLGSPKPAKALAQDVGKPYSTLLREINPYDGGAKLGADTLLSIMKETKNIEPLQYMAEQLGYKIERTQKD